MTAGIHSSSTNTRAKHLYMGIHVETSKDPRIRDGCVNPRGLMGGTGQYTHDVICLKDLVISEAKDEHDS